MSIEEDIEILKGTVRNYNITGEFKNPDYEGLDDIVVAIENILTVCKICKYKAKANKYDSLVKKIQDRIESVEKIYEGLLTDIGGIKIINVSGLSKKEKEEVINKRNCLIIQKATFEEVLQELLEKEKV